MLVVLTGLSIIAIVFNGFEFVFMFLFCRPLGVIQGLKIIVWTATCLTITYLEHWWPYIVGVLVALSLRAVEGSAWMEKQVEQNRDPFYLNRDIGFDMKLNRMFSQDLGKGLGFLFLLSSGIMLITGLAKYANAKFGLHH